MKPTPRTLHGRFQGQPTTLRYPTSCVECGGTLPAGERVRVWIENWRFRGNGGQPQWFRQTKYQHTRCPGVLRADLAEARARRLAAQEGR